MISYYNALHCAAAIAEEGFVLNGNVTQFNRRVNYLIEETDAVYREIAAGFGLSDSAMLILYALQDAGGQIPLTAIYRQTGASKQTINSALRKLEADGNVSLRMVDGKSKLVCLTQPGRVFAARTAGRVLAVENEIYAAWDEDELRTYLRLTEKYLAALREKQKELREQPV